MIDGLHRYSSYQTSAAPWAPLVPAHWRMRRGKALFVGSHVPVRENDEIVTCFRDGQVTLRRKRRTSGFMIALKEAGYQGVRRGQLVIHAMDAFAGAIGVSDSDGKCTPEYIVCEPRESGTVPEYFAQALRLAAHSNFIQVSCSAVRERAPRLRYPNFGDMVLPVPPLDEQAAIVRFLDHADRRIRRYIRAKQQLIKLLEEQKHASVAVLFYSAPDFGAPVPLRYLATKIGSGSTPRGGASVYTDSGFPFLRSQNVQFTGLELAGVARVSSAVFHGMSSVHACPGDVLLNITGASIGRVCVAPEDLPHAVVSQHVCIIRPKSARVASAYLAAFLSTPHMQRSIREGQNGASREGLTAGSIRAFQVPLPPLSIQNAIVEKLSEIARPVAVAVAATAKEIALLREYRTRLFSDVLTGQLDVRAAAAALPDELPDSEPLDDAEPEDEDNLDDSEATPEAEDG